MKNNIKRAVSLFLIVSALFSAVSCGKNGKELLESTEEELEIVGKDRINVFSERYEASGMIRLSKIGFNKGKTEAFVYVELLFCALCSQSDYLLLEKLDGIWTVKEAFIGMRS